VVNIYQKLAVATAGVALSFTPIEARPAQAATITYNYTETSTTDFYGSGSFSFDNSKSVDGTRFNVTDFTLDWYRSNGSLTAVFPYGNASAPTSLPLWDSSRDSLVGEYQQSERAVSTDNFFRNDQTENGQLSRPGGTDSSSGSVSYTQVPEPSGVAGLLVLGLGLLLKKKVASSART